MAKILKQVRMVFDLNKCLGCQTCTSACKSMWTDRNPGQMYMYWNNVETQPGRGYPKNWETLGGGFSGCGNKVVLTSPLPSYNQDYGAPWEYQYEQVFGTADPPAPPGDPVPASAGMIAPDPAPEFPEDYSSNWDEDVGAGPHPNSYYFYLPRICNHCTKPACVAACPRKAVYKRNEDGIVLVDQNRCRGYRYCVKGCPYKKVYFNSAEKVSQKCIFCYPRLPTYDPITKVWDSNPGADGHNLKRNFCFTQCVGRIRYVGYYDPALGPTAPANLAYNVNRLIDEFKVALLLHPEFGTQPNLYYVPPLSPGNRIPADLLANMFGDTCAQTHAERVARINEIFSTIQAARAVVAGGGTSPLIDILTAYSEADRIQI
jgi:DMSO reductase family type II enzyme iron-sulfur subunit